MPQNVETPDYAVNVTEKHEALPSKSRLLWYETGIVLGQGGFGITYLCHDNNLDKLVAIKEYFPIDLATRDDKSLFLSVPRTTAGAYQAGLKRFISEARTLSLFKHPNIVGVSNVFQRNNTAYMVMDYEEGESLDYLFENKHLKTEKQLLDIVLPILDGLRVVHEAGFVHRDIKPSNIYVRKDGSPVLLDFGSARQTAHDRQSTKTTTRFVTPAYAPFEQYDSAGGKQGPWTDIYSLGATLYLIVTGTKPVEALTRAIAVAQHGDDPYQPAAQVASRGYSASFLTAIDLAMMFYPGSRPQSADAWSRMLSGETPLPAVAGRRKSVFMQVAKRLGGAYSEARRKPTSSGSTSHQNAFPPSAPAPAPDKTATATPHPVSSAADPQRASRKVLVAATVPALVTLTWFVLTYGLPTESGLEQAENELAVTPADFTTEPQDRARGVESSAVAAFQQTTTDTKDADTQQDTANEELSAAEQLLAEDRLAEAKGRLQSAERLEPDNVNLARLRAELATREQKLKVTSLLADAERRLASGQLAEPVQDSALAIYRQILAIEPGNAVAHAGLQTIVDRYVELADRFLRTDQLDQAEQAVRMIESIATDNVEASQLRQRIRAQARTIELAGLLSDADEKFGAAELTQPAGDNALAMYRQVLAKDPQNAAAQRGVQNVIRHYLDAANDLLAAAQTARAEAQLTIVEKIDSSNPEAEALRARIEAIAQKQAEQKRAAAREQTARETREKQRQRENAAAAGGVDQSDAERVNGIIEEFKLAFEQRDIERLQSVAHLSPERRRFIEDLFSRHKAIRVSISELSVERRGSASARITIERLITNEGDAVIPAPAWKQARLATVKKGDYWQKLTW
ncbi:MAG: protein kinase domain-containing protein [Gammaproteobacteria bacterium]